LRCNRQIADLPELNEEFAQTLGEFESVDALRTAIRSQLEQNYQQQYDQSYFDELIAELVGTATMSSTRRICWTKKSKSSLHGVEHNLEHDRLDLDTYLKMRQMDRETFINEEVRPAAARRLERSLVLEEFARRKMWKSRAKRSAPFTYTALQQMQQSNELKKIQSQNKQSPKRWPIRWRQHGQQHLQPAPDGRLKAIATGKGDEPVGRNQRFCDDGGDDMPHRRTTIEA
jgi:FKBP-type peptidyl-prolyl cis-trans isomerase (trigger factor)